MFIHTYTHNTMIGLPLRVVFRCCVWINSHIRVNKHGVTNNIPRLLILWSLASSPGRMLLECNTTVNLLHRLFQGGIYPDDNEVVTKSRGETNQIIDIPVEYF